MDFCQSTYLTGKKKNGKKNGKKPTLLPSWGHNVVPITIVQFVGKKIYPAHDLKVLP